MFGGLKRTDKLPTSVVTYPDDRTYRGTHDEQAVNWREPAAIIDATTSPGPVPYSAQTARQITGHARRCSLAIQSVLSVMASESRGSALISREPGAIVLTSTLGGRIPTTERVIIEMPPGSSLSAQTVLNPDPTWAPAYGKLMGR